MPIFSMNVFRLPKEVCEEINGVLAKFWWGNTDKKGMHWYAWKRVSVPKREGGLGFRDLQNFNQALLGKQVWRILQHPECLMARVLRARYSADGNILDAVQKRKASYAWKSILYGKELVKQGLRYVIGDGTLTNLWTDPWLPVHPPRPPRARDGVPLVGKVKDLIRSDGRGWNEQKLHEVVVEEDIDKILGVKIFSKAQLDLLGWHYNEDGIYSVKSGYWLSTHLPANDLIQPVYGDVNLKKKIWATKMPPKIHHFLWKTLSRSLATGSNLKRRHVTNMDQCLRCCQGEESD